MAVVLLDVYFFFFPGFIVIKFFRSILKNKLNAFSFWKNTKLQLKKLQLKVALILTLRYNQEKIIIEMFVMPTVNYIHAKITP